MANGKFAEQINKNCSAGNWDQGNDTHEPTDQAMGGGVSTVKQKCNAATNETQEDDDMGDTFAGASGASGRASTHVTDTWKDSAFGGASTATEAGGYGGNGAQTMQGGGPEYTENHDGPFYGGVDDQYKYTGVRDVRTDGPGARSEMGQEEPTMGFTGDPTENGPVNPEAWNTVRNLKNQTTATSSATEPVERASDRAVKDAEELKVKAENAANDARVKAENAANTAQGKAENAANTVEQKAGGVMESLKDRAEEFFNTDFDNDGLVGDETRDDVPEMRGAHASRGLQDPEVEYGTRSAVDSAADKRIPTAVGF